MYGTSIFDFVQQQRVHKAKQILKSNKLSIQQLAHELGYSNTSNFTNAFKKMTGKAPSEWMKNHA
jgi:AraC-like DNA-binding protein